MDLVDYQKLAEQYASFLVAIGGVSITVLAVVLSLRPDSAEAPKPTEGDSRSYLVTALVVAALSCFIGAQMMAETAAFTNYSEAKAFSYPDKKADRLFLLASANIFAAIILVFFALILLPLASGKVHRDSIKPIAWLFILMVIGAAYWAILAGNFRMPKAGGESITYGSLLIGLGWGVLFYRLTRRSKWLPGVIQAEEWGRIKIEKILKKELPVAKRVARVAKVCAKPKKRLGGVSFEPIEKRWQLRLAFAPSALLTVISLAWFAWIYKDGTIETLKYATISEGWFFSSSIAVSYASLIVASMQTMFGKESKPEYTPEQKQCWIKSALHFPD